MYKFQTNDLCGMKIGYRLWFMSPHHSYIFFERYLTFTIESDEIKSIQSFFFSNKICIYTCGCVWCVMDFMFDTFLTYCSPIFIGIPRLCFWFDFFWKPLKSKSMALLRNNFFRWNWAAANKNSCKIITIELAKTHHDCSEPCAFSNKNK